MNGYSRLASLMAAHDELAIVRGYKSAYALDVLYQQAELLHLLQDWADQVKEDQGADDDNRRSFEYYVYKLRLREKGESHNPQWLRWLEVRRKLREYRQAQLASREVSGEPRANPTDTRTLRDWLRADGAGNDFLRGSESEIWQEGVEDDLIAIAKSAGEEEKRDTLSRWAFGPMITWLHTHITDHFVRDVELKNPFLTEKPVPTPLKEYFDTVIERGIGTLSTMLASLLPTLSIFALYFIEKPVVRLGVIVVLSVLFSAVLMLVAKARRVDCFAATAAFSAVLVVFVGQQGSGSNCSC